MNTSNDDAIQHAESIIKTLDTKYFHIIKSSSVETIPHIITVQGGAGESIVKNILNSLKSQYDKENNSDNKNSNNIIVGFDTESDHETGVEVIQFSTRYIALVFLLSKLNGELTSSLKYWITCSTILKTGVGMDSDYLAIKRTFKVELRGIIDLGTLAIHEGISSNYLGLKKLASQLLKIEYSRGTMGIKWSQMNPKVHKTEIQYAAMDSYVGYKLTQVMFQKLSKQENFYTWLSRVSVKIIDANIDESNVIINDDDPALQNFIKKKEKHGRQQRNYMALKNITESTLIGNLDSRRRKRKRDDQLDDGMSDALAALKGTAFSSSTSENKKKKTKRDNDGDDGIMLNII
jgi:hypothetical protein